MPARWDAAGKNAFGLVRIVDGSSEGRCHPIAHSYNRKEPQQAAQAVTLAGADGVG